MKISISILGSTGSVGLNTLSIVDKKRDMFKVILLSANKNLKLISHQIKKYNPSFFIINDKKIFEKVKNKFKNCKTKILNSYDLIKLNNKQIDVTVCAIPGIAGLKPTIQILKKTKKILLANKESIICGWDLIKKESIKYKTKIIPVDSEHFSIFQLIENQKISEIKKIYITASGGPFLNFESNKLKKISPKDALKHPKWKMGKKISVDSSNLMNKILELVEAHKLFDIPNEKLEILIHPESLVHAIVEWKNGLIKFIYHETSMIIPLANAIFDGKLDIDTFYENTSRRSKNSLLKNLNFMAVNRSKFPIIKLKNRLVEHPSTPIIINASNEILVDQFLQKKIGFLRIIKIIMTILDNRNYRKYAIKVPKNINQIKEIDDWARKITLEKIRLKK